MSQHLERLSGKPTTDLPSAEDPAVTGNPGVVIPIVAAAPGLFVTAGSHLEECQPPPSDKF